MIETCATCGREIYYSVDDVIHLHRHNRSYWCDAVRYSVDKGYVDADGDRVKPTRHVKLIPRGTCTDCKKNDGPCWCGNALGCTC